MNVVSCLTLNFILLLIPSKERLYDIIVRDHGRRRLKIHLMTSQGVSAAASNGRVSCDGRSRVYWGQNMTHVDNICIYLAVAAYGNALSVCFLNEIVA